MTVHCGNHKKHMNRSMRESRMGEFRRKIRQKSEERSIGLENISPKYTSRMCGVCEHVDSKSRVVGLFALIAAKIHTLIRTRRGTSCMGAGEGRPEALVAPRQQTERCAGHHTRRQEKTLVMCTIVYNSLNNKYRQTS